MTLKRLHEKIADKSLTVGVIGLGYVGLPLSLTFLRQSVQVIGFDLDQVKIDTLCAKKSYIKHIADDELGVFIIEKTFEVTTDFSRLNEPDVLLICVPTPLTKSREPDLQYVEATARDIAKVLRAGQLVILESTTYPGTTVEVLQPLLEENGLKAGADFALAYSPEREDPGNSKFVTANIPKVVGGVDRVSTELAQALYALALEEVVATSSTQVAEMTKLLENIFRSVNIALVNELKVLCHRMDIDIWEVIKAASSKPFGYMPFYPGPGLGGHCIPIDPFYLTSKAREYDFATKFIELAGEVNTSMPYYVVQRISEGLNRRKKPLNGSTILILGIAYKKDVDDPRESPSFKLIEILSGNGAQVKYNDPHILVLKPGRVYSYKMTSTPLTKENLAAADCVLIATDHTIYDYDFILKHANFIVDTRNVFAGKAAAMDKVLMA